MGQYENKYKDFKFFGAVPLDFDDLPQLNIKNIDFGDLEKQGKHKIGVIFNLDKHDQPGSHWVSLYADLAKNQVYFSDSYDIAPPVEITKLMRRITPRYLESKQTGGGKPMVSYNKQRAQKKGSECGVYSIAFITRQLQGDSFEQICNEQTPDETINKCRNVYF